MANICTVEMKIKGKEDDITEFLESLAFEVQESEEEDSDGLIISHISGECKDSIRDSFLDDMCEQLSRMKDKIEIEAFCYDEYEPVWFEHYYYKGEECFASDYLWLWMEESDMEYYGADPKKYEFHEEQGIYTLLDQYKAYEWDEDEEVMIFKFAMA